MQAIVYCIVVLIYRGCALLGVFVNLFIVIKEKLAEKRNRHL